MPCPRTHATLSVPITTYEALSARVLGNETDPADVIPRALAALDVLMAMSSYTRQRLQFWLDDGEPIAQVVSDALDAAEMPSIPVVQISTESYRHINALRRSADAAPSSNGIRPAATVDSIVRRALEVLDTVSDLRPGEYMGADWFVYQIGVDLAQGLAPTVTATPSEPIVGPSVWVLIRRLWSSDDGPEPRQEAAAPEPPTGISPADWQAFLSWDTART